MLTATKIQALKPVGKPYQVADSDGLFLLVQPSGALLWRYRYKGAGWRDETSPYGHRVQQQVCTRSLLREEREAPDPTASSYTRNG